MYKIKSAFLLSVAVLTCITVSCVPKSKYIDLQNENQHLRAQLERYESTPDSLYQRALSCVKKGDVVGLRRICVELKLSFPNSFEYKKATEALNKIEKDLELAEASRKAARKRAVYKLKRVEDGDISWYQNPDFFFKNPYYLIAVYIGKNSESVWLRMVLSNYTILNETLLHFEKVFIGDGNNLIEVPFEAKSYKADQESYTQWEWIDTSVSTEVHEFLSAIISGSSPRIEFFGNGKSKTHQITQGEINAIREVLLAYDVLSKGE